jgi:hypothetical protein
VDIAALRREYPALTKLEAALRKHDWQAARKEARKAA